MISAGLRGIGAGDKTWPKVFEGMSCWRAGTALAVLLTIETVWPCLIFEMSAMKELNGRH